MWPYVVSRAAVQMYGLWVMGERERGKGASNEEEMGSENQSE